jgi:hypothetical protein
MIYEIIESSPSGWIVMDYPRGYEYSQPVPLKDFIHAGKQVNFLGWLEDTYILKWGDVD